MRIAVALWETRTFDNFTGGDDNDEHICHKIFTRSVSLSRFSCLILQPRAIYGWFNESRYFSFLVFFFFFWFYSNWIEIKSLNNCLCINFSWVNVSFYLSVSSFNVLTHSMCKSSCSFILTYWKSFMMMLTSLSFTDLAHWICKTYHLKYGAFACFISLNSSSYSVCHTFIFFRSPQMNNLSLLFPFHAGVFRFFFLSLSISLVFFCQLVISNVITTLSTP